MAGPLFRAQALNFVKDQSVGELVFHQPLGLRFASFALLVVIVALLSFAALAPITQTELVRGHLNATQGSLRVFSPSSGTVDEIFVQNGTLVKAGDVLATVRQSAFDSQGHVALSYSIAQVQTQLQQEKRLQSSLMRSAQLSEESLSKRKAVLLQELEGMDLQLRSLRLRRDLSVAQVQRQKTLLDNRQVSVLYHETALDAVYGFEQSLGGLLAQKEAREGSLLVLEYELEQAPFSLEQQLLASNSKISQLQVQLKELEVTGHFSLIAPVDGVVNNILGVHGTTIDSRTPFATLLPEHTEFEALLYVPSRALAKVKAQQTVMLDYDSYPARTYGYFSARVVEVSQSLLDPREHLFPVDMQEPFYLVKASPHSESSVREEPRQLRAGMQFTAHLVVGEQTLLERLTAPLHTLRDRV